MNGAIAAAAQKMRASVHEFAQQVFKCRSMTRRTKQHALNICVARSLYAAQTWRALTNAQYHRLNTQYVRMLRMICGDYYTPEKEALWRNEEVTIANGFLPLHALLRFKRLAYLCRVLTKSPIELQALIQMTAANAGSWAKQLRGDLAWLWINTRYFELMPDPELGAAETAQWERYIKEHPRQWRKCLRDTAQRVAAGEIIDLYPHNHRTADGDFYCPDCDQHFTDAQGLNLHYSLKHDRRTVGQPFAFGSGRCVICLKKYGSRIKLKEHMRANFKRYGSGSCLGQALLNLLPAIPEDEIERLNRLDRNSAAENKTRGRGAGFCNGAPMLRGKGPSRQQVQGPLTNVERVAPPTKKLASHIDIIAI
eukprot:TRINITY_DN30922_c2_g1_i3.p2 TRINITY_DN30922_c2_g1~~TRINITY_DN30922_c2_g1_i3.p2  ORF type:complete len:366 (+),score=59.61 TRINITY_DN30922_c2_g1_i3:1649-2746(+)